MNKFSRYINTGGNTQMNIHSFSKKSNYFFGWKISHTFWFLCTSKHITIYSWLSKKSRILIYVCVFPGSAGRESAWNAEDLGSIPGLQRSPGVGHGNSLQYSCLERPMDRGAWWATAYSITESEMIETT